MQRVPPHFLQLTHRRPGLAPPGHKDQSPSEDENRQLGASWEGRREPCGRTGSLLPPGPSERPFCHHLTARVPHRRNRSPRYHHRPRRLAHLVVQRQQSLSRIPILPKVVKMREGGGPSGWKGLTPLLEQTCFEKLLPSGLKAFLGRAESEGTKPAPELFPAPDLDIYLQSLTGNRC